MRDKIQQIREKALAEIDKADGLEKLNDVRAAILGKKGELTAVLKGMKDVAPDERPKVGQWVNETREAVEKLLDEKVKKFEAEALKRKYESEKIDVTMPAKRSKKGNLHPVTQVRISSQRFSHLWALRFMREQKSRMITIILQL